ncbi:hypothetical protein [Enterovibrio baiacu]|uniref:hypothetical protein n=1 Tax=Enterovibrio baiacu TaxID=2491023 RepID=UPI003D0C6350
MSTSSTSPVTTQFYFDYSSSHKSLAEIYAAFGGYISVYEYMLNRVSESVGIQAPLSFELKELDTGSKFALVNYILGMFLPDGSKMFDAYHGQQGIKSQEDANAISYRLNNIACELLSEVDENNIGLANLSRLRAIKSGLCEVFDAYDAAYIGQELSAANDHTLNGDSMHIRPPGERPSGKGNIDISYKQNASARSILSGQCYKQDGYETLVVVTPQHEGSGQWVFKSRATGRVIKAKVVDTEWLEHYQTKESRKISAIHAHIVYEVWEDSRGKIKPISGGVVHSVDPNKTECVEGQSGEQIPLNHR